MGGRLKRNGVYGYLNIYSRLTLLYSRNTTLQSNYTPIFKNLKEKRSWLPVQDGRVEAYVLISSVRAPKSQLAIEQPSTGGRWIPPKKDTPGPKTKKRPQEDRRRGVIMIKSGSIPTGWVTHKLENNSTKVILSLS